jgi:hypothetical protein
MNCDFDDDDPDEKYQEAKAIVLGCYGLAWGIVVIIVTIIALIIYSIL